MKNIKLLLAICLLPLAVVLPAQTVSYVNPSGNLMVDGEAFLPLGFYAEYIYLPNYPMLIPDMVEGGFNTLVTETYGVDTGTYRTFLNDCNAAELKNIIVLPKYSDDSSRFNTYAEALRHYPSVIAWNLLFNADEYPLSEIELQKQQLLKLDSSRVATADFNQVVPPFQYMLDLLETSCFSQAPWGYPWGPTPDLEMVAWGYRFHAATAREKGVFPMVIPQVFAWDETQQWPSPAHLDCQTYLGYVTGNKGVLFYAFPDVNTTVNHSHPDLYAAAANVADEVLHSEWKNVILHGEHSYHNIYQYKHYATWRYDSALFLIAINASADYILNFEIPLPGDVTGEAINFFDHRPNSLSIQNGMLTGPLAPYQVAIYKMEILATGINTPPAQIKLRAYPNPTTGVLNLSGIKGSVQCEIYNNVGQCVLQKSGNPETEPLDISILPQGVYYLKVLDADKNSYSPVKIIKK